MSLLPSRFGCIPLFCIIGFALTFILAFFINVDRNRDVKSIQTTEQINKQHADQIAKNLFCILLTMCCLAGICICIIRYLEVNHLSETQYLGYQLVNGNSSSRRFGCTIINSSALAAGIFVMFCGFVVAAFQTGWKLSILVNFAATEISFIFALLYCCLQTLLTHLITPHLKCLLRIRTAIIVLLAFAFLGYFILDSVHLVNLNPIILDSIKLVLVVLQLMFLATFIWSFDDIRFKLNIETTETFDTETNPPTKSDP